MDFSELIAISIFGLMAIALAFFVGKMLANREWEQKLSSIRDDAVKKSRSVLGGQFSEQLAPYLPNFPFSPAEVRFLGKPIDFIVFKGADFQNISEVVFVEVKSGNAKLSAHERKLKEAIEAKKVSWMEYRIPHELMGKPSY